MIQLTKDLWVKADDHCYIVGTLRQRAGRGMVMDNQTYYTTMDQTAQGALRRAMRQGVKDNEITTLRQFIQEQERLQAELETLIAPLGGGTPRQKVVEAHQAAEMGNCMSQAQDSEKEA